MAGKQSSRMSEAIRAVSDGLPVTMAAFGAKVAPSSLRRALNRAGLVEKCPHCGQTVKRKGV